jgi:hypothetical protein
LYCEGLDPGVASALRRVWQVWNGEGAAIGSPSLSGDWAELSEHEDAMRKRAGAWADRLAQTGDLAANLAHFCEERLK